MGFEEFVSGEKKKFDFKIGISLASALSGFIAGAVVATIIWATAVYLWAGTHF